MHSGPRSTDIDFPVTSHPKGTLLTAIHPPNCRPFGKGTPQIRHCKSRSRSSFSACSSRLIKASISGCESTFGRLLGDSEPFAIASFRFPRTLENPLYPAVRSPNAVFRSSPSDSQRRIEFFRALRAASLTNFFCISCIVSWILASSLILGDSSCLASAEVNLRI